MSTEPHPETIVNFREFRRNLSAYLRAAHDGAAFVVTSRGEEMARLGPPVARAAQRHRLVGMFRDELRFADAIAETPDSLTAVMEGEG